MIDNLNRVNREQPLKISNDFNKTIQILRWLKKPENVYKPNSYFIALGDICINIWYFFRLRNDVGLSELIRLYTSPNDQYDNVTRQIPQVCRYFE